MIHIQSISKSFGEIRALNKVTMNIPERCIFGFAGPDGAGKTTLFRIIATLMIPDEGQILINELETIRNYREIRKFIGYMPGRFSLYADLTVEENLRFYATIFGTTLKENYHLIRDVYSQIEPFRKRLAAKLSGGMKQKLALSCALIHNPKILVLDEPTTGVDAVSRKEFWELLYELRNRGMTIIVSTPYMDEAGICDEIALIHKGRILVINKPEQVITSFRNYLYAVTGNDPYKLTIDLKNFRKGTGTGAYLFGQSVHFSAVEKLPEAVIAEYLEELGNINVLVRLIQPTIEDCFISAIASSGEEN